MTTLTENITVWNIPEIFKRLKDTIPENAETFSTEYGFFYKTNNKWFWNCLPVEIDDPIGRVVIEKGVL